MQQPNNSVPKPSVRVSLAAVSLLFGLSIETSMLFIPLHANSLGASNLMVGLIVSSYGISYFLGSFIFGRESDIHGRTPYMRLGLSLSAIDYLCQVIASGPLELLAARSLVGLALGMASAPLTAYVYESGSRLGNFSSYGSLGFFLGAFVAAAVGDIKLLFVASAVASAIASVISFTLKEGPHTRIKVAVMPWAAFRTNRKIYLPFFLRHFGANGVWAIFPLFLASIGASKAWIAGMEAINTGGQFLAMRLIDRFNPAKVFTVGLIASAIVFVLYAIVTDYQQIVPVQVVLAVAWSCLFVGALNYLLAKNVERGTAAGLLYSTSYLAAGTGPFAGGVISQIWGFDAVMFLAASLTLGGVVSSLNIKRRPNTGSGER